MTTAADFENQRRAARSSVAITAQLRVPGATKFEVALLDLSTTGFRCETFYGLTVGSRVLVTIPSFAPFDAQVLWKNDLFYGCAFERPLHEAVLATIVARFPK